MNSRRMSERASPGPRSLTGARGRPAVVRDAQQWVAGLKGEVQSMLAAFRRQHAEDAGGAIERISGQVSRLRLGVSDLLPRLREARLQLGEQDQQDRQAYLASIAEWVDGVKATTGELCGQFQEDRARLTDDVSQAREAVFDELTRWGDALREDVAELTEALAKERAGTGRAAARARRAFIEHLREDVAALLASFHRGGVRSASAAGSAVRAVRPPFAGAATTFVPRAAAAAATADPVGGTRESILKSLRERAMSAAMRPSDERGAATKTGRGSTERSPRASSRRAARR